MQIINVSSEVVVETWGGQDYEIAPGMVVDIEKGIAAQFIDRRPHELQRFSPALTSPGSVGEAVAAEIESMPTAETNEKKQEYPQEMVDTANMMLDPLTCAICAFKAKTDFGLKAHMRKHKYYKRKA